ncbi:hypothetical protein HanPI659440_Chr00c05g0715401 [Helianthus annuus]|nr:hypothetical protein HanPI659440_Chr00c05g0715401 [Helianthus annuus]
MHGFYFLLLFCIRVVRIVDLVNQSKKGSGSPISKEDENNIVTESDKGFLHDVIMTALDTHESNAEKKVADKKRKSLEVWLVIAASAGAVILGVVAYFRHQKSGVVYREHRNRWIGYFVWFTRRAFVYYQSLIECIVFVNAITIKIRLFCLGCRWRMRV